MHATQKAELLAIRNQAMQRGAGAARVSEFLRLLGPFHETWHTTRRRYGFLLFHFEVIRQFRAVGGPAQFGGIRAYTAADFRRFRTPYSVSVAVGRGDVRALEALSLLVERWHNGAHMGIGMAEGVDLMNARTNIRLVQFWRLHYFINARLEVALRRYRRSGTQTIDAVIAGIESSSHSSVPFI